MQLEGKFIRVAHDPGDPQITSHCPFCGSGQVTGRSDGTIDCAFCGMNYIVRVQPAFPGMPQQPVGPGALTDIGPEMGPGGMEDLGMGPPGMDPMMGDEEGMPPGEEGDEGPPFGDDEEGPPGGPEDDADEGGSPFPPKDKGSDSKGSEGDKKPPKGKKKEGSRTAAVPGLYPWPQDNGEAADHLVSHHKWSIPDFDRDYEDWDAMHRDAHESWNKPQPNHNHGRAEGPAQPQKLRRYLGYRTLAGDQLDEPTYIRHLAVLHSGSDPRVLAQLRREAHMPGDPDIDPHLDSHHSPQRDDPYYDPHKYHDAEHEWEGPAGRVPHEHEYPHGLANGVVMEPWEASSGDVSGSHDFVARKTANSPDAEIRAGKRMHQWLYPVPGSLEWQPSTGGLEHRAHARRCAACGLEGRAYPGQQGGLTWRYARSTDFAGKPEREHSDWSECPGRSAAA